MDIDSVLWAESAGKQTYTEFLDNLSIVDNNQGYRPDEILGTLADFIPDYTKQINNKDYYWSANPTSNADADDGEMSYDDVKK